MSILIDNLCGGMVSILDVAGMLAFLTVFFKSKSDYRKTLIYVVVATLSLTFGICVIKNSIVNMTITTIIMFVFTSLFETSIVQKIFALCMYLMTIAIVDVTVTGILVQESICGMDENLGYYIISKGAYYSIAIASKFLTLVAFAGLRILFGKMAHIQDDRGTRLQYIMMMVTSALCLLLTLVMNNSFFLGKVSYGICTFVNFCMISINIIVYMMYYQMWRLYNIRLEKKELEDEYRYKQDYYSMLESHQNEIRTLRHDMKNRLIGIIGGGLDVSSTKKEINSIMEELSVAEKQFICENPVVNAVLNSKLEEAKNMNIEYDIDVKIPSDIPLSAGDIGILLGNLLDNSIEAAAKCDIGKRFIWFKMVVFNKCLVISCTNTTPSRVISLQTNKEDQKAHGIGLKSVDSILEKYHGERLIHSEVNKFTTEINLWL